MLINDFIKNLYHHGAFDEFKKKISNSIYIFMMVIWYILDWHHGDKSCFCDINFRSIMESIYLSKRVFHILTFFFSQPNKY